MMTSVQSLEGLDTIGFARLHALVARGYRPVLGVTGRTDAQASIAFTHPRTGRNDPTPPVTLWSDGILATTKVLFPQKYVPEEGKPPPDWQRYILPTESDRFETFLAGIASPGFVDLYVKPFVSHTKTLLLRLAAGAALCTALGLAAELLLRA